jgi:hypothetical protein
MIKAAAFYRNFEAGFAGSSAKLLRRSGGSIPKYTAEAAGDTLSIWFKVSGKASAIPYQPGEFWPVIQAKKMRHGKRDDGLLSWYQYTDKAMEEAIVRQRWLVYDKVKDQSHFEPEFWRQARDLWLTTARDLLDFELRPGFPHSRLYYLDEADAMQWGVIFGMQIETWLERFRDLPETLEMHMWRVHWSKT